MSIVAPLQGKFDGGEISPLLYGRVDSDRYKGSLALCKNWISSLQGGLVRRPGTNFIGTVKDSTKYTRLLPFSYSTTQSYILEFGNNYIRFYANYGQVQVSSVAFEVATPYSTADLPLLRITQSADTLYIVHPNYLPAKLQRLGSTDFQLVNLTFIDGPYNTINIDSRIKYTPSAASGSSVNLVMTKVSVSAIVSASGQIKVTASAHGLKTGDLIEIHGVVTTGGLTVDGEVFSVTVIDSSHFLCNELNPAFIASLPYISGGSISISPFTKTQLQYGPVQVGQCFRYEEGGVWGWGYITGVLTSGIFDFSMNVVDTFGGTTGSISWTFGLWFGLGGGFLSNFPGCSTFHEDRLCFSGTPTLPQRVDGSYVSNYESFKPTAADGTVTDSNAISFNLNSNDVNLIEWLSSNYKGMLGGSVANEWAIRPSDLSEAITPTNISAKVNSRWGSAPIQSAQVGLATLHIQRGGMKLRELIYSFYVDGFVSTDLTELAEHITGAGVIDIAYQRIPLSVLWMLRKDGAIVGMTYDRDQTQLRSGFHQHFLGGQSDAAGSPPVIESIAVIPSPDGTRDDLWMTVRRWINGATVRTIEYLTKIFQDIDLLPTTVTTDPFTGVTTAKMPPVHLDASLTLNNPVQINAMTNANPIVCAVPAHGLSTGQAIRIDNAIGMAVNGVSLVNTKWFKITATDSNHFSLQDYDSGANIDGSAANPYIGTAVVLLPTGVFRKLVTTISGLTYLQGEAVSVLADGCVVSGLVVNSSGQITLPQNAAIVSVGYSYNSDVQTLRLEAGSRNGTSLGKTRRTHRVGIMVHNTNGLSIGPNFNQLDPVQFKVQGVTPDNQATALFTGIESHTMDFDYDFENQFCVRASSPLPAILLAILPQLETQDRQ